MTRKKETIGTKSKDLTQKAAGALQAILNPESVIEPPAEFDEEHRITWNELIGSKPHEAWRPADRFMLQIMVRSYHDILRLTEDIHDEGESIMNARGTPVCNPKVTARNAITMQFMALATKLRLTATSRDTDEENNAGRNEAQKKAKRAAKVILEDDDDLLASGQTFQ